LIGKIDNDQLPSVKMNADEIDVILSLVLESQAEELPLDIDSEYQKRAIKTIAYEVIQVLAGLKKNLPPLKTCQKVDPYQLHQWLTYWADYWSPTIISKLPKLSISSQCIVGVNLGVRQIVYFLIWLVLFFKIIFKKRPTSLMCYSVKQGGIYQECKFILNTPDASASPIFLMYFIYLKARYILPITKRMKFIRIRDKFQIKLAEYLSRDISIAEHEIIKYFPFEYIYASCTVRGRGLEYISDGNYSSSLLTRLLLATRNVKLIVYQHGNNFLMRGKLLKNTYESAVASRYIGWGRETINSQNILPNQRFLIGSLRTLPELKKEIIYKKFSLTIFGCDSSDTFIDSWAEKSIRREIVMSEFIDNFSKQYELSDANAFIQYKTHPWDDRPRPHLSKFYKKYCHKINFERGKEGLIAASLYDSTICWLRLALNRPTIFIFDDYDDVVPEYREMIKNLFDLQICFSDETALFEKLSYILENQNEYIENFLKLDIPKIISPYIIRYG